MKILLTDKLQTTNFLHNAGKVWKNLPAFWFFLKLLISVQFMIYNEDTINAIKDIIIGKEETIAVAESGTAGHL